MSVETSRAPHKFLLNRDRFITEWEAWASPGPGDDPPIGSEEITELLGAPFDVLAAFAVMNTYAALYESALHNFARGATQPLAQAQQPQLDRTEDNRLPLSLRRNRRGRGT